MGVAEGRAIVQGQIWKQTIEVENGDLEERIAEVYHTLCVRTHQPNSLVFSEINGGTLMVQHGSLHSLSAAIFFSFLLNKSIK